jgi:hypothetical protein
LRRSFLATFVALVSLACGAASNPGAPTAEPAAAVAASSVAPTRAVLTIALSPNPIVSGDSGDLRAPRLASWQVVLRETGGVGATVNFVNSTLRDAVTGVLAEPHGVWSLGSSDVLGAAGSNRLAAGGSLIVPQIVSFSLPDGDTAPGRLEVTVQVTDDNGNVVGASATATMD